MSHTRTYRIEQTGETFRRRAHTDAYRELVRRLDPDGPYELTATTDDGVKVHASLEGDRDEIIDASGRRWPLPGSI